MQAAVHYRFGSSTEEGLVQFNGPYISVADLKKSIIQQKGLGKNGGVELTIRNDQTKEVYKDDALIAKNSGIVVLRVPAIGPNKHTGHGTDTPATNCKVAKTQPTTKYTDLTSLDIPEDEKIRAMMIQSTQDYDPSNYKKVRGWNQTGPVPRYYCCRKCHKPGHWIKDCPLGLDAKRIRKSSGIPRSFMTPVEGPYVPGAMMTPDGTYAVVTPAEHIAVPPYTTAPPQMPHPSAPDSPMSTAETTTKAADEQQKSNVPRHYSSGERYTHKPYHVNPGIRNNTWGKFQGSMHGRYQRNQRWDNNRSRPREPSRSRYEPYRRQDLVHL